MEYQKMINFLHHVSNQPSKVRTKTWIEINDQSIRVYSTNSDIRFKTTMLKSILCDYSDACILDKGTITITGEGVDAAAGHADERDKGVIFKNCAPFSHNLIEYIDNYSKTSGSLWQYYRDEPNNNLKDSESFNSKLKITGKTPDDRITKDVEIIAPLKYLSVFRKTLEMPLINCEVNLILTWLSTCVITNYTVAGKLIVFQL